MKRKLYIIPILVAYALVLMHNLVPHTHHSHEENFSITHLSHNFDQPNYDGHKKDKNEDTENHDSDFLSLIFHTLHTINVTDQSVAKDELPDLDNDFFICLNVSPISFDKCCIVEWIPKVEMADRIVHQHLQRSTALRAPPVIS